jgi:hypothetical protein
MENHELPISNQPITAFNLLNVRTLVIEDIYQAAQVYACAALEICNWDKPRD